MSEIRWYRCENKATQQQIKWAKEIFGVEIPKLFCELMVECDAGIPIRTDFEYYDAFHQHNIPQAIGGFLGFHGDYNIIKLFTHPPEFFPKGLIAFAETGGGDFICFDYRQGKDNSDPPIVFWRHGAPIGKDVSFVASNFSEFLKMLKEPEEF